MIPNRFLSRVLLLSAFLPTPYTSVAQKSDAQAGKTSSAILIGTVSSTSSLVRLEKLGVRMRTLSNGQKILELPQQSEYLVGTIYQVRINELVKGNKMLHAGQTISILILGPANVSDRVVLFSGRKHLLQLSLLADDAEKYKGTAVMDLAHPAAGKQQFDPHNVFTLISDLHSAVPITAENKGLVERIRRAAKDSITP